MNMSLLPSELTSPCGSLSPGRRPTLDELLSATARASIVGLGLTARGVVAVRELHRLQCNLAQYLAFEKGFGTIAIEDRPEIGERLTAYLTGGSGTLADAVSQAWSPWKTPTFLEFFEALRRRNAARPQDAVRVIGIDIDPEDPDRGFAQRLADAAATDRVVYLGGVAHTASCPVSVAEEATERHPAGYLLRKRFASRYRAVALAVGTAPPLVTVLQPPLLEAELDRYGSVWLDVSAVLGAALDALPWCRSVRAIGPAYSPDRDSDFHLHFPTLRDAFDAVAYVRRGRLEDR